MFERIVCDIDETPESLEAARQAAFLRVADGLLVLVAVADLGQAAQAGYLASTAAEQIWRGAEEGLRRAVAEVRPTGHRLVRGRTHSALLAALERERATLVALGAHGRHRSLGLVLGATATTVLRDAPCSVLLARPQRSGEGPPRRIVLGVDGSLQAELAAAAARDLQRRFGGELRVLSSLGGKAVDIERVRTLHPDVETDRRSPVEVLVEASAGADLLVVGSRGLHGFRALGSVSERVAHRAPCSVLVVRARREEPPVEVSARPS